MEISAAKFRELCQDKPDETARVLLKSMREFGYSDLTFDEVKAAIGKALTRKKTSNVIVIWIRKYLENGVST